MKKNARSYALMIVGLVLFMAAGFIEAQAADSIKDFTVNSAVSKMDKNGNPYVRFIVQETKQLNGVEYKVGVPVMAFGEMAEQAKAYPEGAAVKAIVRLSPYNGNDSYTILAFVKQ